MIGRPLGHYEEGEVLPTPRRVMRDDREVPLSELRDLIDHLAEEIAADYQRLLTGERERPSEEDRSRETGADG